MENKFRSVTIFEFQESFPDEDSCYQYLSELKWCAGFACPNCGHTNYCNGKRKYDRQCTSCHRITSPTSGTLFHQLKFSVLKAFYIVYYVSTSPRGISSTELSRKLGLRQKTCWKFKVKVMKGNESSGNRKIDGGSEIDKTVTGGQEKEVAEIKGGKKKLVVFEIGRNGKGVSQMYRKVKAEPFPYKTQIII